MAIRPDAVGAFMLAAMRMLLRDMPVAQAIETFERHAKDIVVTVAFEDQRQP